MSGIAPTSADNERALFEQLIEVAGATHSAATYADGEYIPQLSREGELERSFLDSARAAIALEQLAPHIARLDGGDDGLRLAQQALHHIASGRMALRDGMADGDDIVRGGTLVEEAISTGSASRMFREAETKVRGIADIALMESLTPDEAFAALLNRDVA